MAEQRLIDSLTGIRRRLVRFSLAAGGAWGVVALIAVLVLCAWVDLALDLPGSMRLTCTLLAFACGVALIGWWAIGALRNSAPAALARRLDSAAESKGQILSGVDLQQQYAVSGGALTAQPLSGALARIAIERAATLAAGVRAAAAVSGKPIVTALSVLTGTAVLLTILAILAPRLVGTQAARFFDPFGDHPPYSSIVFDVQPGDTRIIYGNPLDIRAKATGGVVEELSLVLVSSDGTSEETLPMFAEPGGAWRATVATVTAEGRYYVRAPDARSKKFSFGLITIPELKDVRFRITPPAYTRLPAYEGPLPQTGLSGLPGTKVELWAKSNRALASGALTFTPSPEDGTVIEKPAEPTTTKLSPIAQGASEVTGSFTITQPGKIQLNVTDVDGQGSKDSFTASVSLLNDDRPFVRIMEPRANSYATADVTLNVAILAEDDYGVSRVQLFRSLNDSRPLGVDAPVPDINPTRVPVSVPLHLSQYGLKPGDVVKLFARVEDNDPAGAKGSESSIVTVQIISREELNRMTLAREAMEVLQAKYQQARRRLEALDEEIRKVEEELKKADPDSKLAEALRKRLEDLAKRIEQETKEIAKDAAEDLPFDIDRNLREQLKQVAKDIQDAGKEFRESTGKAGLSTAGAKEALDKLRQKLGTKQEQLKKEMTEPLEHLAKVFPLKEDEMRFLELYERQLDLAQRMAALQTQSPEDPRTKVRMRDLEAEQRQMRDALAELLNDIDKHVKELPSDPKLDDLRKGAQKFADAVRASEAATQMQNSEIGLSEFDSKTAAKESMAAAETLKKFIKECNGMGEGACDGITFQPTLSAVMGNSIQQLLDAMGFGNGPGSGGMSGGYSARRNSLSNVGLYGSLPRMSRQSAKSGNGRDNPSGMVVDEGRAVDQSDPAQRRQTGHLKAAGETGANIPANYRRKVGEYFQRVADELGE